jgi:hypothetical protein
VFGRVQSTTCEIKGSSINTLSDTFFAKLQL